MDAPAATTIAMLWGRGGGGLKRHVVCESIAQSIACSSLRGRCMTCVHNIRRAIVRA